MNNNFDLVIIYRRMEKKNVINYIPVYCEVGTYNQESEVFTTTKGKKYHHMIEGEEYAFLDFLSLDILIFILNLHFLLLKQKPLSITQNIDIYYQKVKIMYQ